MGYRGRTNRVYVGQMEAGPAPTSPHESSGPRSTAGTVSMCVSHSISPHPFTNLSSRTIEPIGRRLRRVAEAIDACAKDGRTSLISNDQAAR